VLAYAVSRRVFARRVDALPAAPTLAVLFLSRPVPVLAEAVALAAGAARLGWPRFLAACGAGNVVYAGALAVNGASLVPEAPLGAGLVLPMALPALGWLAWRVVRRAAPNGG
jgi:membrane protein DedA with SNARE-associated domain